MSDRQDEMSVKHFLLQIAYTSQNYTLNGLDFSETFLRRIIGD